MNPYRSLQKYVDQISPPIDAMGIKTMTKPDEYIEYHGSHFDYETHRALEKHRARTDAIDAANAVNKAFTEYENEMETKPMTKDEYFESSAKMVALKEAKALYENNINTIMRNSGQGEITLLPYDRVVIDCYKNEITRIKKEIELLGESIKDKNGWRPIETANKKDQVILCAITCGRSLCDIKIGSWSSYDNEWRILGDETFDPTHWMPLPKEPEEYSR